MNLTELNQKKWTAIMANVVLFFSIIMILKIFIILIRNSHYPEATDSVRRILLDIDAPYFTGGIILTVGLLIMSIFKSLKSNIGVIVIGIFTLALYYSKMLIGI